MFIVLIGKNWLPVYDGRRSPKSDKVIREIRTALRQDREIIPVLTDDAVLPDPAILPADIRTLSSVAMLSIAHDAPIEDIAARFANVSKRISRSIRLGPAWTRGYTIGAVAAYYFCAVHTHIIGVAEFGLQPWLGMAQAWSGFYVWPMFFLPFTLVALYRPLTLLVELTLNARTVRETFSYGSPLIFGTVVALLAASIEVISPYQVPWSVHPLLPQPGCQNGPITANPDLTNLSSYDPGLHVQSLLQERPFWLDDRCWPNVFFYLTVPVYRNKVDAIYDTERLPVQRSFETVLKSSYTDAPYSKSFIPYVISFTILIWLAALGILQRGHRFQRKADSNPVIADSR